MGQDRSVLSPRERARITELEEALVDRLFKRDEAIAAGQESRAEELQAEIHDLLREKEEIEKWAVSDRPSP